MTTRIAIIANLPAPYRLHLHQRIAAELDVELHSIFTHTSGSGVFPWKMDPSADIHPYSVGDSKSIADHPFRHPLADIRKAAEIFGYMTRHEITVAIVNGYNDLTRLILLMAARFKGIRVFIRTDSNILADNRRPPVRWIKRLLVSSVVRRVDGSLPMGTLGRRYYERYGADRSSMFYVPCEPDYAFFSALPQDGGSEEAQRISQVAPGQRVLVYVGRLAPEKRVDLVLDAFLAVSDRFPDWDLFIVGDGRQGPELRARLPQSIASRVHWFGFLDQDDLRFMYQRAGVFVLASDFEPWGVVVQEALGAGVPVVVSDAVGSGYDAVVDSENGRIFRAGSLSSLTRAIEDVIENQSVYERNVPGSLVEFREAFDPVVGLRDALASVGISA